MMRFSTLLKHPANWMKEGNSSDPVVVTSRVRLARNITGEPFPGWADRKQQQNTMKRIRDIAEQLPEMKGSFSHTLSDLSNIEKQVLVERHLISREQAAKGNGSAVIVNRKQNLSLMINEEDHLRIQGIEAGLNLMKAYKSLSKLSQTMEEELDFAFDLKLGYLTACPTNVGTGMRASAMLHLPGLVLSDQIRPVLNGVNKLSFAVRGFYGEGTDSLGDLFQISNQSTLGLSEEDIITNLERVILEVAKHEKNARQKLLEDNPHMIYDQIGRAYGVLRHAHILTTKEALNLLSLLRLAAEYNFLPKEVKTQCSESIMLAQPAQLQLANKTTLPAEARDTIRAEILRTELQNIPNPVIYDVKKTDLNNSKK